MSAKRPQKAELAGLARNILDDAEWGTAERRQDINHLYGAAELVRTFDVLSGGIVFHNL